MIYIYIDRIKMAGLKVRWKIMRLLCKRVKQSPRNKKVMWCLVPSEVSNQARRSVLDDDHGFCTFETCPRWGLHR